MEPIRTDGTELDLILRSRAKHGVSGTISPVAVLRDGRESALLEVD
jgi:hypothetical protein